MHERVVIVRKSDGSWHVEARKLDVTIETRPDGGASVDITPRENLKVELETPPSA